MSGDITRQRAEIEGTIAGRTLCDELRHVAETAGDGYAYSDEVAGQAAGAGSGSRLRRRGAGARRASRTDAPESQRACVVHAKYADVIDAIYDG